MSLRFVCVKCQSRGAISPDQMGGPWSCLNCGTPQTLPANPLTRGYLLGEFEIAGPIGAGLDGAIHLVYDTRTNAPLALRVPDDKLLGGDDEETFFRQVSELQKLGHPNLIRIISTGRIGPVCFYVMEYCDRGSLADRIHHGQLDEPTTLSILDQLGSGLECLHQNNFFPRDLTPAKVMFDATGTAKIGDYMLAQPLFSRTQSFETKTIYGTPTYISPEQASGGDPDARSNLYTLGVIAFEMLTGRPPFAKKTEMETIAAHLNESPPDLTKLFGVSAAAAVLVQRLLAKNPADRFPSAADFIATLRSPHPRVVKPPAPSPQTARVIEKPPPKPRIVAPQNPSPSSSAQPEVSSNKKVALLAGVILIIICGLAVTWVAFEKSGRSSQAAASSPNNSKHKSGAVTVDDETSGAVKIRKREGEYNITTSRYRARVGPDGNLHKLEIGNMDLLDDTVGVSRGAYYYWKQPLDLESLTRRGTTITATDGTFTAIYDFGDEGIDITLRHRGNGEPKYIVIPSLHFITVKKLPGAESAPLPTIQPWGDVRLDTNLGIWMELHGGERIWGPWSGKHQVWETTPPRDRDTTVKIRVGKQ